MIVDEKNLSTYINPDAKLRQKTINTVRIRREEDGYHLNLGSPDLDFTPKKIENHSKLLPAVEITEEIELDAYSERCKINCRYSSSHAKGSEEIAHPGAEAFVVMVEKSRVGWLG